MSTLAPKSPRLDLNKVRAQIDALRAAHPDIWEDDELLADMLEGETDLHELLTEVVQRIRWANALSNGLNGLIAEAKARQDRFERRVEVLRAFAFKVMQTAEMRSVELPQATLSIRTGQPKVIVTNEAALPLPCVRIKREPDKLAIRGYMNTHGSCPGAELSNAEPTLSMQVK